MKYILSVVVLMFLSLCSHSQQMSNDTLHWSGNVKLNWNDFAGKFAAKTGMMGRATLFMNAKFRKGLKATTLVETIFDRKYSSVSSAEKTPAMLKYYQTLFDLYEAEARKLRKKFKETKFGLDPEKVFQEKYNAALQELSERADLYMEETETGNDAAAVGNWAITLQIELQELESFKK